MIRWSAELTRKRAWALGKRLFGASRMSALRQKSRATRLKYYAGIAKVRRLQVKFAPLTALKIDSVVQINQGSLLLCGTLPGRQFADSVVDNGMLTLQWGDESAQHCNAFYCLPDEHGTDAALDQVRFIASVPTPAKPCSSITFTTQAPDGAELTVAGNCCRRADHRRPLDKVRALLALLPRDAGARRSALDEVLGEAIVQCWQNRPDDLKALHAQGELVSYNPALAHPAPATSVIIPIYGRFDFISFQLAAFVRDASLHSQELLYVIDDPALHTAVRACAAAVSELHDIAFSVLYLEQNLGYAGANNAGAKHARSDRLLLMNSDVMPIEDGWLDRMHKVADKVDGPCVVGARLIYEDGSVQHDGMRFDSAASHSGLWLNIHPGKGLPADLFEQVSDGLPREAVTGACLLIDKAVYEQVGGLDENYILGDFEDSDLCLKARGEGAQIRLASDATLYHLERQSQSLVTQNNWKRDLTWFNCWFHSQRWDASIQSLKMQTNNG